MVERCTSCGYRREQPGDRARTLAMLPSIVDLSINAPEVLNLLCLVNDLGRCWHRDAERCKQYQDDEAADRAAATP
jgi:hypothetical protein